MLSRRVIAAVAAFVLVIMTWLGLVAASVTKASFWRARHGKHHIKLLQMYKHLHSCMQDVGISYWICSGTLLGAVRNNGFIPWDDDIDLGMDPGQFSSQAILNAKMSELCKLLQQRHKLVLQTGFGVGWQVVGDAAHIDIFYFRSSLEHPGRMEHASDWAREMWPEEWYRTTDLFPLRSDLHTFEGLAVPTPANPLPSLQHYYGPMCLRDTLVTHLHADTTISEFLLTIGIDLLHALGVQMRVDMSA